MFGPAFASSPLARLGIRYPIIQAPMAGLANPTLAAAVCEAGGLGSLGMGPFSATQARNAIRELQSLTSKPFNINVFVHDQPKPDTINESAWLDFLKPVFEEVGAKPPTSLKELGRSFREDKDMLDVLLETKPAVISFHFGVPRAEVITQLKDTGATLLASATSLDEAKKLESAGMDMIVAQGIEAGGHRGIFDPQQSDDQLSTFALTSLLLRHTSLPIIPAGGIMDGASALAYLTLGASAVQLGTAFILCSESSADKGFRATLQSPAAHHTALTPLISGRPARCLQNKWTEIAKKLEGRIQPGFPIAYDAGKALHAAAKAQGEEGYGAHWAGQGAPMARNLSAGEMVRVLVQEMEEARRRMTL